MAPTLGCLFVIGATLGGAIAQLGERIVRNDEVGGSIPPGSTSLRSLRDLRLGKPAEPSRSEASEGCRAVARRAKAGSIGSGRELRLGKPAEPSRGEASEGCRAVVPQGKEGLFIF